MSTPDAVPPPEAFRTRPGNRRRLTPPGEAALAPLTVAGEASGWPQNQTAPGGRDLQVSDELRELVAQMYRRDYRVFGYSPDHP